MCARMPGADGWLRKFEKTPNIDRAVDKERLDGIGGYGVSLAGPQDASKGDLTRDVLAGRLRAMRLDYLREALIRDGLFEVVGRADDYARSANEPEAGFRP